MTRPRRFRDRPGARACRRARDEPVGGAQDARVAAQKEGKVVWYTSLALPSSEKVAKLFEAAYPGVKVEVHRTGSQRILQRVMQELAANIKNADVVHTSDAGHYVLLKDKKLLHVDPDELEQRNEEIKTRFVELFGA